MYVALLRGINLGSKRRVAMADLRALLEGLGYDDVRTHLQSGNGVFRAQTRTAAQLAAVVEADPFAGVAKDPARRSAAPRPAATGTWSASWPKWRLSRTAQVAGTRARISCQSSSPYAV